MENDVFLGELPEIAGLCSGRLLVIGSGHTLLSDIEKAGDWGCEKLAVNAAGIFISDLDHYYSSMSDCIPGWLGARGNFYSNNDIIVHANKGGKADYLWPVNGRFAPNSGVGAAVIGCGLGYDEIVLAGIPADGGLHFHPHWEDKMDHGQPNKLTAWERLKNEYFDGRVTSLSGNTREMLGAPKWLK